MSKIIKFFRAEVKDIDSDKLTLTAVISTKKTDRDGDIVEPEAFRKRIKTYKEHPVLLSSHNYGDLLKQIGKAEDIKIEGDQVIAKFKYFAGEGNAEADWAWKLAQKGIAAYSIGFMGHQFDWIKDKDKDTGAERITGRKFTDIELLEVSQVLVPSNRGALQQQVELCELVSKSFNDEELKTDIEQKPKPQEGESREEFMQRCIPILIDEGKEKDQAVAVCSSLWDNRDKSKEAHYADNLLGEAAQAKAEPQSEEISIEDIKGAVNGAVAETMK